MDFLYRIAESRILEAIEGGLFDNLQGRGKPLVLEDDSHIPPELRMAYKIMKMADCLPPELEMRKEIVRLQDLVASLPDEAEKLRQMRRLNFLVMKLGLSRPLSPLLQEHDLYGPKVLERLESKK
jgi:hypothetical protein